MKTIKSLTEAEIAELPKLPERWRWVRLEEITNKITDGEHITPKRTESGYHLLSARNVQNGYLDLKNVDYVPKEEYFRIRNRCNPEEGDILISCSGSVGRVCSVPKNSEFVMVRSVALVKLSSKLKLSRFFEYQLQSPLLQRQIEKGKKATAQANLFLGPINNLKVIFSPLPEQRAIVSKIEQLFSELDNGISNLKLAQEQLKVYRQAVLKKAFEGKLTKKWREQQTDLPDAEDLLEKIRKEREETTKISGKTVKTVNPLREEDLTELPGLPDGWRWGRLGELTDMTSGHAFKKSEYSEHGVRLFQIANVSFGHTIWDDVVYLPEKYLQMWPELVLKEDDLLIALNRPLIQRNLKICRLHKNDLPSILYQRVGRLDFFSEGLVNYILYFMQGPFFISKFEKDLQGIDIPFINKGKLLAKHVPLCSKQEMQVIVQEIETRLSICDKIEQDIKENLEKAEALRQSILKKAFEGKLLNESELAEVRKAEDWEPAEVLLERIKAKKAGNDKKGKQPTEKLKSIILDDKGPTSQDTLQVFEQIDK